MSYKNIDKRRQRAMLEEDKKTLKYTMVDLIKWLETATYFIVIACMILFGIFIFLVFST